jgi:hypothetical protein
MQQVNQESHAFGLAPEPNMPQKKTITIEDILKYKNADLHHLHISRSDISAYCLKCEKHVQTRYKKKPTCQ